MKKCASRLKRLHTNLEGKMTNWRFALIFLTQITPSASLVCHTTGCRGQTARKVWSWEDGCSGLLDICKHSLPAFRQSAMVDEITPERILSSEVDFICEHRTDPAFFLNAKLLDRSSHRTKVHPSQFTVWSLDSGDSSRKRNHLKFWTCFCANCSSK